MSLDALHKQQEPDYTWQQRLVERAARGIFHLPETRRAIGYSVAAGCFAAGWWAISTVACVRAGWNNELVFRAGVWSTLAFIPCYVLRDTERFPLQDIVDDIVEKLSNIDIDFSMPVLVMRDDANHTEPELRYTGDVGRYVEPPRGVSKPECVAFARYCLENSRDIAENNKLGKYGISGPKYRKLRDWGVNFEFLRWRNNGNHRLGVDVTRIGYQYFSRLWNAPPPHWKR